MTLRDELSAKTDGTEMDSENQVKEDPTSEVEDVIQRVVLEMDGGQLRCDQGMLSKYSDYFKAMFSGRFNEYRQPVIALKDVNAMDMELTLSLLDHLDDICKLSVNDALGCLQISSMFQFHTIQKAIEEHITHKLLDTSNWFYIAQAADAYHVLNVAQRALVYGLWKFTKIHHTEAFLESTVQEVQAYLSSDFLFSPRGEMEVLVAANRWLNRNNRSHPWEVLSCVRYRFLSTNELSVILNSNIVKNCPKLSKVIWDIKQMKSLPGSGDCYLKKEQQFLPSTQEKLDMLDDDGVRNKLGLKEMSLFACGITNRIISYPRHKPLAPCIACRIVVKENGETEALSKKPTLYAFCFDETRKRKLYPFMTLTEPGVAFGIISRGDLVFAAGDDITVGDGEWNKTIQYYDIFKDKWVELTNLPPRRHRFATVLGDEVYILCGDRDAPTSPDLNSFEKYNIVSGEWTALAPLPDGASCVAVCAHKGSIFVLDHEDCSCCQYSLADDSWTQTPSKIPPTNMIRDAFSYGDYIYVTAPHTHDLYKFRPDCNSEAIAVGQFTYGANATCLVGYYIYSFTVVSGIVYVERYDIWNDEFSVVWTTNESSIMLDVHFVRLMTAFPAVNCLREISLR